MIPLSAVPWRLVGYGVAVAAVLAAGWWLNGRLERANEADRLEQDLAALRADVARQAKAAAAEAKLRAESEAREAALAARIAAIPKERLVYVPKPVPGQPLPAGPCPRISDEFVRAYNEAVTGQPAR